jgi:predicted amidohydrolase YtcJ
MRHIFKNGTIFRGDQQSGFQRSSTLVVKDSMIEYVGDNFSLDHVHTQEYIEHDLQGRVVLPSFIDAHMHLLQFGASLVKVGLDNCKNLEDIRRTISDAARQAPQKSRILCRGWRQSTTSRVALASMLDDLDPRPIYIDADDMHSEWCNSAALWELGISKDTPDPEDGTIARDKDGNPTGLISEGAVITLVWPHLIGVMNESEKIECIMVAQEEYLAAGYSGVVEMAMDEGQWNLLEKLHQKMRLKLRIAVHWIIRPEGTDAERAAQVQRASDLHAHFNRQTSPNLRVTGIKIICDGVVDSCTAALSTPYSVDGGGQGELLWDPDALRKVARQANEAHLQIALHAIGDAAVNLAINTLEGLGTSGRRHRIEHLELTRPEDAKRLGQLGVTASIQPVHSDPSILGAWPELIGDRTEWAFTHRKFLEGGAHLAIGTDSPTAPHKPMPNLYVANQRTSSRDLHNHTRINRLKGLDMHTVFGAATWGAAFSCFAEDLTGSIEVGKSADFIIVSGLAKNIEAGELLQASVDETWFEGARVFHRVDGGGSKL